MGKGLYIVFEGIDGCGKSSQSKLAAEWIRSLGIKVRDIREHSWGKIGTLLRQEYLTADKDYSEVDALLFAADRMVLMYEKVRPAMVNGEIVVSDRNYISSLAYQAAQGRDQEWIIEINKHADQPDMIIIVDIDPKTSISRVKGEDKFEKLEFLEKVKEFYDKMGGILPNHNIIHVDGNRSVEEVHEEIKNIIKEELKKNEILVS